MNDQLQQALSGIIAKTTSGIDAGLQFLSAQIPDVIHQLLVWKLVSSLLTATFLFLAAVVWAIVWVRLLMATKREGKGILSPSADCCFFVGILGAPVAAAAFLFGAGAFYQALQIWLAPKIFLIEYAASLAKG